MNQLESQTALFQVEQAREPVTPRVVRDEQTEDEHDQTDFRGQFKQVDPVEWQMVLKQAMTAPMNMDKTVVKMVPK